MRPGKRAAFTRNQIPVSLFDPVARKLFADTRIFPQQTVNSVLDNLVYATHSADRSPISGDMKIDYKPKERVTLFHTPASTRGNQDSQGYNSYLLALPARAFRSVPMKHGVANWTRTISPRLVNEARIGVNHSTITSGNSDNGLGNYAQQLGMANAGSGLLALRRLCATSAPSAAPTMGSRSSSPATSITRSTT